MSPTRFVGLLLFISVDVQKGLGQDLQPRCSNPQGIYVTEEGSAVEVCFMLFNGFVPPMITFSTEGTFNLDNAATGRIDFMNDTFRVNVSPSDQDVIELCPVIETFNDEMVERTEYFAVSLRTSEGLDLASCQVAIIDRNGGPSNCYEVAVTDVSLTRVINDEEFCFRRENAQCLQKFSPNVTTASDCTRWNQTSIENILTSTDTKTVVGQLLPNISAISRECVKNVLDAVASLYGANIPQNGDLSSPPPRQECATNCVLTVSNSKTCDTSVLLLEQVFRGEATNFLNDLKTRQQSGVCTIRVECCDLSQPLPSICGESMSSSQADPLPTQVPNTVTVQITGTSAQGQATSVAENIIVIIIAAVLGSILGLVLVGGAVALILFLILRRSRHPPSHKEVISAIQVGGIVDHQTKRQDTNEYATIDCRDSAIRMENNSAYMCNSTHCGQEISTDDNIAYYSSNRAKNEDDHDYVYEYI